MGYFSFSSYSVSLISLDRNFSRVFIGLIHISRTDNSLNA